jgi:hypothetical protein
MNKELMSVITSLWLFSASGFSQVRELPAPAGRADGQPNLAVAPDGRLYLSWIKRLGEGRFSLRFALKEGDGLVGAARHRRRRELVRQLGGFPFDGRVARRLAGGSRLSKQALELASPTDKSAQSLTRRGVD